jgi:hypothetical protein
MGGGRGDGLHSDLSDAGVLGHAVIDALLPDAGEKGALAGSYGSPGPANAFVTAADAPATPAPSRIVRLDGDGDLNLPAGRDVFVGALKGLRASLVDLMTYDCSSALTLTGSYQNVAGCTTGAFTPEFNETAVLVLWASVNQAGGAAACNAGDQLQFRLYESTGASAITSVVFNATGNVGHLGALRMYRMALNASQPYTIVVQARNLSGNRGQAATGTSLLVWRLLR